MKEQIVCQFHDLSHEGLGVGKVDGKVIFAEGALPGEKALIQLVEDKKKYSVGEVLKIIEPSKKRIKPVCPYFEKCGGCQIQHIDYSDGLNIKKTRVVEQLKKTLKGYELPIALVHPSINTLFYRNKIELKVNKDSIGFYQKKSHELLNINHCYIANPVLNEMLKFFHSHIHLISNVEKITLRTNQKQEEVTIIFHGKKEPSQQILKIIKELPYVVGALWVKDFNNKKLLFGHSYIKETILGKTYKIDSMAFLQVNIPTAEVLYKKVIEALDTKKNEVFLDAYCGVGILSCIIAQNCKKVVGLDIVKESIDAAKENSKNLGINNIDFYQEPFEKTRSLPKDVDIVLLNPPRGGCHENAIKQLKQLSLKKIIYVSCDPATLSRDLVELINLGYKIIYLQIFDLFPQTMHVETLILLEKH